MSFPAGVPAREVPASGAPMQYLLNARHPCAGRRFGRDHRSRAVPVSTPQQKPCPRRSCNGASGARRRAKLRARWPHSAPLGLAVYDGGQFRADYRGDLFVALHGSWNRARRTGYKIIRVRLDNGRPTGAYEDIMTGFVASDNAVRGRPVGAAVTADGALLVSDDASGTVWRVAYAGIR